MVEAIKNTPKLPAIPTPKVSVCAGINGWSKVNLRGGEIFEGWFVNGTPKGQGALTLVNGTHYEGDIAYNNGVMTITGKVAYTNGKVCKSTWYKFVEL